MSVGLEHRTPRRCELIGVLAALLACGAGCKVYDPALLAQALDAGARRDGATLDAPVEETAEDTGEPPVVSLPPMDADLDAAADAGTDAGAADACVLAHPPERPVAADPMGGDVRWYAVRHLDFGTGIRWRTIGYDLDGRCSDETSTDVECAPPPGFAPPADGAEGRDNSFGSAFIPVLTLLQPTFETATNDGLELGHVGVLLRVAGWNGTPTDPVVDFALVESPRGFAAGGDPDGGTVLAPAWDGTDEWTAATTSFVSGDLSRPLARDSAAYVVDSQLVAHPRDGTELVFTNSMTTVKMRMTQISISAQLADGGRRLDEMVFAGRWALDDLYDTLPAAQICPGSDQYTALQEALRRSADLTTDGNPTPFLLCQALSVGIGAQAFLATVSRFGPPIPVPDRCVTP